MMACAGDYLRIWQLKENGTHLIKLLNNVRAYYITPAGTCFTSRGHPLCDLQHSRLAYRCFNVVMHQALQPHRGEHA